MQNLMQHLQERKLLKESRPYRFSQQEFEKMCRHGWFTGQSAELVDGEVVVRDEAGDTHSRHWTRDEYLWMSDWGWFNYCKVQMIGGEVIEMAPQLNTHAAGVTLAINALQAIFGQGYWVRSQATLDLSPNGMPDPDVVVIPGSLHTAPPRAIPTNALLVVEVSDSSLRDDRVIQSSLYAAGGIADYWIINLVQRQLEVHRNPVADATKLFGWWYADRTILVPGETVSPLAAPQARVAVEDLLP